jgi:cytochrome b561
VRPEGGPDPAIVEVKLRSYDRFARMLHWTMAALVALQIGLGLWSASLELDAPMRSRVLGFHKSLGILLLYLVAVRLWWRVRRPPPPQLDPIAWRRTFASAAHGALYALLFVVPLSGALMSLGSGREVSLFGLLPWPQVIAQDPDLGPREQPVYLAASFAHKNVLTWALIAAVGLHLAAVIKHHLFDRDPRFLRRMTGA